MRNNLILFCILLLTKTMISLHFIENEREFSHEFGFEDTISMIYDKVAVENNVRLKRLFFEGKELEELGLDSEIRSTELCSESVLNVIDRFSLEELKQHHLNLSNFSDFPDDYGLCLMFYERQTEELCIQAIRRNREAFLYVKNKTRSLLLEMAILYSDYFESMKSGLSREEILFCISKNNKLIKSVDEDLYLEAVERCPDVIEFIPQTEELCLAAIQSINFEPQILFKINNQTSQMCDLAFSKDERSGKYIRNSFIKEILTEYAKYKKEIIAEVAAMATVAIIYLSYHKQSKYVLAMKWKDMSNDDKVMSMLSVILDDHENTIKDFLERRKIDDVNIITSDQMSPLSYAIMNNKLIATKYLISKGADLTFVYQGQTPIELAFTFGSSEMKDFFSDLMMKNIDTWPKISTNI